MSSPERALKITLSLAGVTRTVAIIVPGAVSATWELVETHTDMPQFIVMDGTRRAHVSALARALMLARGTGVLR